VQTSASAFQQLSPAPSSLLLADTLTRRQRVSRRIELIVLEDGLVHFYDDIYGHDADLEKVHCFPLLASTGAIPL
jgi:hypothetical protein